jgi:hypothetical protein
MSMMMFTRCLKRDKTFNDYDLSSIVNPSTRKKVYTIPSGFIKVFVKDFKLNPIDLSFEKKDIYLSTKSSINGPATLTAMDSILNLDYVQMQNIYDITDEAGIKYFNELYTLA